MTEFDLDSKQEAVNGSPGAGGEARESTRESDGNLQKAFLSGPREETGVPWVNN